MKITPVIVRPRIHVTINDLIKTNPVTDTEQVRRRRKVLNRFSAWLPENCPEPWDLMLYPFTAIRPLKYIDLQNVAELGIFFEKNKDETLNALTRLGDDLSHAISTILQPSVSWGKEHELHLSSVQGSTKSNGYVGIEQIWHPEYQRYTEHAFNHLINIPLAILENQSGKQYCNQTLAKRVEALTNQLGLSFLKDGYNPIVRNAISHGRIKFTIGTIEYKNVKPNGEVETAELSSSELMKLFDRLVASCSELVTSLVLFMLHYWSDIEQRGLETLPAGLLQLALTGAGTHRNLKVTQLIESETGPNKKQLIIACSTNIISRSWQRIAAFHLTALAQSLSGEKYARFGIEFDCGRSSSASVYLNGERLLEARQKNVDSKSLSEIVESQLLWYDSPSWYQWFINPWTIFRTSFIDAYEKCFEDMGKKGIVTGKRFYDLKYVGVVGAPNGIGIEVKAVLKDGISKDKLTLKSIAIQIINQQRLRPRRRDSLGSRKGWPRLPSYIRLHIYPHDDVLRNLHGRIRDGALIEVEWEQKNARFIYVRAPHEIDGNMRTKYADKVLLMSEIKTALDEISNQASIAQIYDISEIEARVTLTATEILSAIEPEATGLQRFWLFKEIERYSKWAKILHPAYTSALQILREKQNVTLPDLLDEIMKPEQLPKREEDVSPAKPSALPDVLYAFFLQHYLFSNMKTILVENQEALQEFNSAYHGVLQGCVDNKLDPREGINLSSGMRSSLEDALYELKDTEQIAFFRKELGQAISRCSKLMPKYKEEVYNGADEMIQSEIDDAKRYMRHSSPDVDKMQILYSSLVDMPYTMQSVLRRKSPNFELD